ncbi:MAG: sulfatase-like hydrolase/transferase [Gemmatimonadetes bacterium]|nr:sulfatase-like hydrolase/transferase [Gemmatimonadota bacterium]
MHKPILRGETVILQLLAYWPLAPVTLWWVAVDLYMRPALDLRLTQWGWWLLSVGFSLVMWQGLFSISRLLRARRQMVFVGAVSLVASAFLMASIGFYRIFYCWPTAYVLVHIFREPREAWGYIRGGADLTYALLLFLGTTVIAGSWRFALRRPVLRYRRAHHALLALLFVAGLVTFATVHRHASAMVPDAAGIKLSIDLVVNAFIGGVRGRLLQAHRPAPGDIYGGAPVDTTAPNLIVIVGESVSAGRTGIYGYRRQTTPRLAALREERPEDWVQFARAVSNASATKVSLPVMLTGLFPSREPVEQHTFPLLWHYARAAGYRTALISSQSYTWNNLEGFFIDEGLQHVFTLERSDAEIVNSEGIDDREMLREGLRTIDRFAAEGPFVVVLQFNCTHYPGYSPPDLKPWAESDEDPGGRFDNSIAYMDHLLGQLFEHLEERGLAANTSVIFAADHGEDLDNVHNTHRTDSYYQTTIAVPFFAVVPERHRQVLGARFDQLRRNEETRVALADLVPTAVDLIGLAEDTKVGEWLGKLDGRSLLRPVEADRLLVVVNTDEHVRWSRKGYAVLADDWKFINYSWRGSMLFDLASDRLEQRNLLEGGEEALGEGARRHLGRVRALVEGTSSLQDVHTD